MLLQAGGELAGKQGTHPCQAYKVFGNQHTTMTQEFRCWSQTVYCRHSTLQQAALLALSIATAG